MVGHNAWNIAGAPDRAIDLAAAQQAARLADKTMDDRLSIPAWHDLGATDQTYLHAVAEAGGEADRALIARAMSRNARTLANAEQRLTSSGYITSTPAGRIALTDLMPSRVVLASMSALSGYGDSAQDAASSANDRCNEYMPRAKTNCVLTSGHAGGHRSGQQRHT